MDRRREALGRNRRGPGTRNLVPMLFVFAAILGGLGWFAYDYFTTPQRVFGAKHLDCPAYQVDWESPRSTTSNTYVIRGCQRSVAAECPPKKSCFLEEDVGGPF